MRDLLAKNEVFEQCRAAQSCLQRILVVADRYALVGRQRPSAGIDAHAIERAVAGIDARRRLARANLVRRVGLGQRAAVADGSDGVLATPGAGVRASFHAPALCRR